MAAALQQDDLVEAKRWEIRDAMRQLGRAIQGGDDRELLHWVMPGLLAVAHRPLRYHPVYGGSRARLSPETDPLVVLIPATLIAPNFWAATPDTFGSQLMNFFKNVAALGSLLILAVFDAKAELELAAQTHHEGGAAALEMVQ